MSHKFSQNLIERTQEYFKEKYSLDISTDTTCEYLASLASLFLAFTVSRSAVVPLPAGDADAIETTILPTVNNSCSLGDSNTQRTLQNETNI